MIIVTITIQELTSVFGTVLMKERDSGAVFLTILAVAQSVLHCTQVKIVQCLVHALSYFYIESSQV